MKYIVYKRFKGLGISGYINLPRNTQCLVENNIIYYKEKPIAYATSENAHQYFTINEDNNGLLRGELIQKIILILNKNKQKKNLLLSDNLCKKYIERKNNIIILNHLFYIAEIDDLKYILNLIKEIK